MVVKIESFINKLFFTWDREKYRNLYKGSKNKSIQQMYVGKMSGNGTSEQKTLNVLVIDDEEHIRDLLEAAIMSFSRQLPEKTEVIVNKADSTKTGLGLYTDALDSNALDFNPYDLVFTDLNHSPTGLDAARKMRELSQKKLKRDTPVAIITGGADEDLIKQAKVYVGEKHFLKKPFGMIDVDAILKDAYNQKYNPGQGTHNPVKDGQKPATRRYETASQ